MTRLDHGALNLPLAKRGDIDAQIGRYKQAQARGAAEKRRAGAADMKIRRDRAKALVSVITPEQLSDLAAHCDATPAAMRKRLKSDAHWQPDLVIKMLAARGAA